MPIVNSPASLNLSGNLPNILVDQVLEPLAFTLTRGGQIVLNEIYYPDTRQLIEIRLKDLISKILKVEVPPFLGDVYHQTEGYGTFTATIGSHSVTFTVVKAGVDLEHPNAVNFFASNWLTWQPQQKKVQYYDPEWLTYYSPTVSRQVKLKAYFADKTSQEITYVTLPANQLSSINLNPGHIRGKFSKQPLYWDIWTESSGVRNSFIQRYVLDDSCVANDDIFVFENTLGGIDTVRFTGEKTYNDSYDTESVLYDDVNEEYFSSADRVIVKNTGYFPDDRFKIWSLEFFSSVQRFYLMDGNLRRILLSKPELESTALNLSDFRFTFQLAKQTKFLNLPRADELPANLEIVSPGDELFFLAPRLNEFGGVYDLEDILFPVQLPFDEIWKKITFSQLEDKLTDNIRERIPTPDLGNYYTKEEVNLIISESNQSEKDTLQSVTSRGSTSDRILSVKGTRNQSLLSVPPVAPNPAEIISGENYLFLGPGSGSIRPTPSDIDNGFASIFTITSDTILNWSSGMSLDEEGQLTDKTWAERYGNAVFVTRLFFNSELNVWQDESNQVSIQYSGDAISTIHFTSVIGTSKIIITGKGGGTPVGVWTMQGTFTLGKEYYRSEYVIAPSSSNPSELAFYFLIGDSSYVANTLPSLDPEHWSEVPVLQGPPGLNAKDPEFGRTPTHLVWRLSGESNWNNLIAISELEGSKGDPGVNPEFSKSDTHLLWRLQGEFSWKNLIPLTELQGKDGKDGKDAVVHLTEGMFVFEIVSGDLIMTYRTGDVPPDMEINENGDLILNL